MTTAKSKLSVLKLVYPPISNQEAVWIQDNPDVEMQLRESDFYMIGGRAEAKFSDIEVDQEEHVIMFNMNVEDGISSKGQINILKLPNLIEQNRENLFLEAGEKIIRLWDGPINGENSSVLDWFTSEKLLWDRWRGKSGIEGLGGYRDMTTYDLLYVGIAKKGDSFDRLIKNGHKARLEILANEPQRYPGARVTDETYLFLFKVEPLIIQTFDFDHKFTDDDLTPNFDQKSIVADAEKAFVSLLKPEYNVVKFKSYPKGKDGLYDADYARYCYVIGETITFNTPHGRVRGACGQEGFISNEADCIFIEGDDVKLMISGEDYPSK